MVWRVQETNGHDLDQLDSHPIQLKPRSAYLVVAKWIMKIHLYVENVPG